MTSDAHKKAWGLGDAPAQTPAPKTKVPAPAQAKTPEAGVPDRRVTLNLPPELYHAVAQLALDADGTLMLPRVSIQRAMRAMLRAATQDDVVRAVVIDMLRRESGR